MTGDPDDVAANVASAESTGGAGTNYEARVAATVLARMLVGETALQEKRKLAAALAHYAPVGAAADDDGVLPPWTFIGDELRYAEPSPMPLAPRSAPSLPKLLADVCGFLVTVSQLDPKFRTFARQVCAQAESAIPASNAPQTTKTTPTANDNHA